MIITNFQVQGENGQTTVFGTYCALHIGDGLISLFDDYGCMTVTTHEVLATTPCTTCPGEENDRRATAAIAADMLSDL